MGSLETATTQPGHTMGTKLSKATNTPPADKSSTLPAPHNDEDESKVAVQSETLPRSGFERTTGLGKSFRKSMRKLVGKRTVRQRRENRRRTSRLRSRKLGLTSSRRCTLTTRKRSPRLSRQRPKRMRKRQSMSV